MPGPSRQGFSSAEDCPPASGHPIASRTRSLGSCLGCGGPAQQFGLDPSGSCPAAVVTDGYRVGAARRGRTPGTAFTSAGYDLSGRSPEPRASGGTASATVAFPAPLSRLSPAMAKGPRGLGPGSGAYGGVVAQVPCSSLTRHDAGPAVRLGRVLGSSFPGTAARSRFEPARSSGRASATGFRERNLHPRV